MVDKQAELVYTLPINIHSNDGACTFLLFTLFHFTDSSLGFAYPPLDKLLHKCFVIRLIIEGNCKRCYLIFFDSLFFYVAKELWKFSKESQQTQKGLASKDFCQNFYVSVL